MKRILDGLLFGSGFALAFLVILYFGATLVLNQGSSFSVNESFSPSEDGVRPSNDPRDKLPFHELSIEDKIKYASVIAIAEYQPDGQGKNRAIITEILKHDAGVTFYYKEGDEFEDASHYVLDGKVRGDGVVLLFTGSPAEMRNSMSFYGKRIAGLGDMPIEIFREKCAEFDD